MATLICGSLAFDSIATFPGRFADQILPEKLRTQRGAIRYSMARCTDEYKNVMGLEITRGRWFGPEDDGGGYEPMVISEALAGAVPPLDVPKLSSDTSLSACASDIQDLCCRDTGTCNDTPDSAEFEDFAMDTAASCAVAADNFDCDYDACVQDNCQRRLRATTVARHGHRGCAGPKPTPVSFCNTNAISIPDSGIATPYPSSVTVSGLPGVICKVTVNLNGITHAVMPDIDAMLSRPTPPTNLIVMSDVGPGAPGVSALSLTLDDAAAASIPVGPVSPGAYQPTNDGAGDPFAAPAPTPSSAVALSTFDGSNPNGTWNLWLVDDTASSPGSMSGWCVNIAAACVTDADCVDSDACTGDSCNLANGQCVHTINGDTTDTDGDRLTNCVETNTGVYLGPMSTGTNPNNPDTDGDAIRDGDEVLGTLAGLNLPAMGASPLKKNILLEYDWFNDNNDPQICLSHSHRPTQAMIDRTSAAFASAPVLNPDGTTGITLIHDYGQGGAFTGGNLVADADGVITGGVNDANFQGIKGANFATNRRGYFHYTLLPHRYNTTSDSSGQAELPGNDLIVSLYCFSGTNNTSNTIMHELGHNLLLRHGGNTNCNWMPNYNSVMNYRYQFPGIDSNASCDAIGNSGETNVLSYSIGARLSLNENALNEFAGVCGAPPIDWNGTFAIENPVAYDLNRQGTSPTSPVDPDELFLCGFELSTLNDFNDWANFVFTGLNDVDFAPPTKTEVIDCQNPSLPRIVSPEWRP
jgi:subtilisin-like proprotein convertase family protein